MKQLTQQQNQKKKFDFSMPKIKQPYEEISQISTIRKLNSLNSEEQSFIKLPKSSHYHEEKNEDSNFFQKLIATVSRKENSQQVLISQNIIPVTNQRKLNSSSKKVNESGLCKSTFNVTNANYAIQSEPNCMQVSFSSYFEPGMEIQVKFSDQKIYATRKIYKFLLNFDLITYTKYQCFNRLKMQAQINNQSYTKSFQTRQYHFIDKISRKNPIDSEYNYAQIYNKTNISYTNKLVGLCNSTLISKQKQRLMDRNIQRIKQQRQSKMRQYSKIKQAEKLKSQQKSIYYPEQSQNSFIFNFDIHPRPKTHFQVRLNSNDKSLIRRNI